MDIKDVKTICVVGAGNMGHQIALQCALYGYETYCTDVSQEMINKAQAFAEKYLPERVAKGKLTAEQTAQAKAHLHFVSQLSEAAKNADFVIEAVVEKVDVKRELFAELDKLCPPHAILASNSSNIVSSQFADVTSRPEKVCNMHFFNPALVMKVVEVVKGPHTSEETVQITIDLTKAIGKTPVVITKEIYGFVVNRILGAITGEAFHLAEEGYATPQDIDIAVEGALGHPMGPFRLMDLTGLDLAYTIRTERYKASGDPKDKPPKILEEKFKAGEYGRKTGKGFYTY